MRALKMRVVYARLMSLTSMTIGKLACVIIYLAQYPWNVSVETKEKKVQPSHKRAIGKL